MRKWIEGEVIEKKGKPQGNHYKILGTDGIEYFAHMGDLKKNEDVLYKLSNLKRSGKDYEELESILQEVTDLNLGDKVVFCFAESEEKKPRAFNVRLIPD